MSSEVLSVNEWLSEKWDNLSRRMKDHFEDYDNDKKAIAKNISLAVILISAALVRLFPLILGWDPEIKAFDPWMQLRAAEYIMENGFISFLYWKDTVSWYPYGRNMGDSLYIGVPLAIVLVHNILTFIGLNVTIKTSAVMVPVIFGTLGVLYTYKLGKELISTSGGLIAAAIMVAIPAYVSRSIAGFVDNESIGVLLTVVALYYFNRALNRDSARSAIFAGISMAMLGGSWGAFRFAYDLLPVYALIIVITGRYTTRFLKTYTITVVTSSFLMILIPRVGGDFLTTVEGLAPVGMIAFLVLFGIIQNLSVNLPPATFRRIIFFGFIALLVLLGGIFLTLVGLGVVEGIGDKFISVILPDSRNDLPLIDSVSEHLTLAWGNLYINLYTLVFFIPVGLYFALEKPTEKNLFIFTFGLVTIYFSGSMVRLMLLLAPAAAILTALAVENLLKPFAKAAHGRIKLSKTTMSLKTIDGNNAFITYALVFFLIMIMINLGIGRAATTFSIPELTPSLSQDGDPNNFMTDWTDAFQWMQTHTSYTNFTSDVNGAGYMDQQPPIMLSWWDYGYYITGRGNTATLVDNATTNSTQIGTVGTMLMYNATAALPLMYQYNVKYVLVVPAAGYVNLGSDLGKAVWMIRISEQYTKEFGVTEEDYFDNREGYKEPFYQSVLYRLMAYKAPGMSTAAGGNPPFASTDESGLATAIEEHPVTELQYFTEVFRSVGVQPSFPQTFPVVRIYQVNYPADIDLMVNEFNMKIDQIRADLADE